MKNKSEELKLCTDPEYFFCEYLSKGGLSFTKNNLKIIRRAFRHKKYLAKSPRRYGKTSILLGLSLYYLLFQKNENIVYLSSNIRNILDIIRDMINYLPYWMAHQIIIGNNNIKFGDNVLLITSPKSETIRGMHPTTLLIDDLDFFYDKDFIYSLYPILSFCNSKIKILSSVSSTDSIVNQIYKSSEEGYNDFVVDTMN